MVLPHRASLGLEGPEACITAARPSIGGSLALFFAGKKLVVIFVGLWPPTCYALKSVADTNKENRK